MAVWVTMEFEDEGPANAKAGDSRSEDALFARHMPRRFDELAAAAAALGVTHVFDFAPDMEALWDAAEQAVSERAGGGHDEDALEELIDREYYSSGPWFDPDEGLRSAEALAAHFRASPAAHEYAGLIAELEDMAVELREGKRRGCRFRLYYSY